MTPNEVSALYVSRALELEKEGKYKEAERLTHTSCMIIFFFSFPEDHIIYCRIRVKGGKKTSHKFK